MPDREKVLKALEHHKETAVCIGCPYAEDIDTAQGYCPIYDDAIALLGEQEPAKRHPRVMTLEEVQDALDTVVWLDDGGENTSGNYALVESYSGTMTAVWFKLMDRDAGQQRRHYESYGKRWRCWDIRPTDEQRRAVKWDD